MSYNIDLFSLEKAANCMVNLVEFESNFYKVECTLSGDILLFNTTRPDLCCVASIHVMRGTSNRKIYMLNMQNVGNKFHSAYHERVLAKKEADAFLSFLYQQKRVDGKWLYNLEAQGFQSDDGIFSPMFNLYIAMHIGSAYKEHISFEDII